MPAIVVLVSGRGTNLRALVAAELPCRIAAVISNRPEAAALAFAREQGIATAIVDHVGFASRAAFEHELTTQIDLHTPTLVVLAGFMRIFSPGFVAHYAGRLLNIHPSLLPAYPGLHTHRRALADGVRVHGCTVHFVTDALDSGPIIVQAAVPVHDDDNEDALSARVLAQEHRLYPQAVRWYLERRLDLAEGRIRVVDAPHPRRPGTRTADALIWPALD
ncbi:MAG: phosphoribosylglycinamide formyltransferase [Proteobacteria bacterium]|nr:phosphoribosylglycinamide formyltransferase [Burkholderiales bacterium]